MLWLCSVPVDWGATGDYWSGLGTLAGAGAVIWAANKGASTFDQWRKQKLGERHIDQAERIMTAVDDAKDALRGIRSPMMWAHEEEAARRQLEENHAAGFADQPEDRKGRLITAQAYYSRINRVKDRIDALNRCRPMARAFFGDEIEQAISKLHQQFWIIQTYADAYVDAVEAGDFRTKVRAALYNNDANVDNEVSQAVITSVATIEARLLPILRSE
jgi:hypothetical protein